MAIASLVLSLLSVVIGPFGFIPGIVCGHIAKSQIRKRAGLQGTGLATAGLVIGYACLVIGVVFLAGIVAAFTQQVAKLTPGASVEISSTQSGQTGPSGTAGNIPVTAEVLGFSSRGKETTVRVRVANEAPEAIRGINLTFQFRDANGRQLGRHHYMQSKGPFLVDKKTTEQIECTIKTPPPGTKEISAQLNKVTFSGQNRP